MFFERIIEWDWDDAPARVPIFAGDIPKKDEPLPKFLDDPTFARFMPAARSEKRMLTRLAVELLARTGMRLVSSVLSEPTPHTPTSVPIRYRPTASGAPAPRPTGVRGPASGETAAAAVIAGWLREEQAMTPSEVSS